MDRSSTIKNEITQIRWPHATVMTCLLAMTCLFGCGAGPARAQFSSLLFSRPYQAREEEIARLKGLEFILYSGVAAGENFDHDANLPSRKEFDALVESSFRRNAVPTMTLDEANTAEAKPRLGLPYAWLMLVVDVEKSQGANSYIYRMDVDIYEDAVVSRTGKMYPVSIWHRSTLGSAVASVIKPAVNAAIGKLIDEFGGEYLVANPSPLRPGKPVSSSPGLCTSRAHYSTEIYSGIRQQQARRLRRA